MTVTYLETLNCEQRRAVEHGVQTKNGAPGAALLVIAGAGSGKTNTIAHRVAHLIVNGADPRRILLMTFSRRAAAEMTRRVERIARQVMGASASAIVDALTWVGNVPRYRCSASARICRPDRDRSRLHHPRP
jgi:DNA helicase II / ATP-dependent DNA helicase PcrA